MTGMDFHQHVWPDAFRRALEARSEPPFLRGRRLVLPRGGDFDVDPAAYAPETRLAELDRAGLDRAVVSLPPTMEPTAELAAIWNDAARTLPPRLVPLAYEAALPGFAGAVVSASELRWVDCIAPLLSALEQAGQVLFVHPGAAAPAAKPWWTAGVAYTGQMQDAFAAWVGGGAARWPRLKVVFAFLAGGAPFQVERLIRRGLDPRSPFAGTSGSTRRRTAVARSSSRLDVRRRQVRVRQRRTRRSHRRRTRDSRAFWRRARDRAARHDAADAPRRGGGAVGGVDARHPRLGPRSRARRARAAR